MLISVTVFVYYSFWVIATPFYPTDHFMLDFFPPRHYAVVIPTVLLVLGLTVVGVFLALVMMRGKKKKKQQQQSQQKQGSSSGSGSARARKSPKRRTKKD